MAFGKMGAKGGFGSAGVLGGAGTSTPVTPTVASAAVRAQVPFETGALGTNNIISTRIYDWSMVTVTSPRIELFNGWVNTALAGAAQELAIGNTAITKASILTGVNATQANTAGGYNQSGATLTAVTWTDVANDTTAAGFIMKLDDTVAPPTFTAKTYAQFQADGGSVSGTTITRPSGYYVVSDAMAGVTLTASVAYAIQLEDNRPPQQTASAASQVGTTVTVTVPSTARYRTNDKLNFTGFTPAGYNTTAQTPARITVIDATTLTYQATGGLGAVTVLGNVQATKVNTVRSQSTVATNGFGDIQATSTAAATTPNTSTNWSGFGTANTGDNNGMSGVVRVTGTSAQGKKSIGLFGDSIAAQVGDNNQLNPSGSFIKGDAFGATGPFKRAFRLAGYSFFSAAVPGAQATVENSFGGGLVRQYIARGASALVVAMVHNDATTGNFATLQATEKAYWATLRAAIPTSTKLVAITASPLTAQVASSQWNARSGAAQSFTGNFAFPAGIIYANWNPYILGTLVPANGDPDAGLDFAQYISDAFTPTTIDGFWPANGSLTAFWGTPDGTHPSFNVAAAAAIGIAAALPAKVGF